MHIVKTHFGVFGTLAINFGQQYKVVLGQNYYHSTTTTKQASYKHFTTRMTHQLLKLKLVILLLSYSDKMPY